MTDPHQKPAHLPERISNLVSVAANLGWSWDAGARDLFASIDRTLWSLTRHNPLALLQKVDPARLDRLSSDSRFLEQYDQVVTRMSRLSSTEGTWFAETHGKGAAPAIAYFCAEFALHNSVPIYSGGLGVLAGDHCKAASDLGVPLVGVGLLYTKGYFDQRLRPDGWQEDSADHFDPAITPLTPILGPDGSPFVATVNACGRLVHVGAWRILVGRVPLYLLDTNLEQNEPGDREILHQLYSGGSDLRLLQEWILGVGGVRVLRALGIQPAVWHSNEGHASFMLVERVRELALQGVPFAEAVREVRRRSVFTTHTPVAAGHDRFSRQQLLYCVGPYWDELGVDRDTFLRIGSHPTHDPSAFHMTVAAIRLSSQVTAVSARHEEETRRMWHDLWNGRDEAHVPIQHVTNGVHAGTWIANSLRELLDRHLGPDWSTRIDDPAMWQRVLDLDDAELWAVHLREKQSLFNFMREDARRRLRHDWREAAQLASAGTVLASGALTIGFARRFTAYKRPDLIFHDPDRLRAILVDQWRPVQLIFAGKAHPADEPGKRLLQKVYSFTRDPAFEGRIAFLEDYELHLAHRLVQGVDLWLNVPRPPLEASGTSGMKAAMNAVPQLGTNDGWWAEGHTGMNGWMIDDPPQGQDTDSFHAARLYELLEQEIVPLFYDWDDRRIPGGWIQRMKHALAETGQHFNARRMVEEYVCQHYLPVLTGPVATDDPPTAE